MAVTDEMVEAAEVTAYLRERTALRYMGDCKCGQCRLVERPQLDAAADLITRQAASLREAVERVNQLVAALGSTSMGQIDGARRSALAFLAKR